MKLQALKILVVTMAFLILIGLGFLAYGIAANFAEGEKRGTLVRNPLPLTLPVGCLLYTSPSPRDLDLSRMPSSA